MVILFIEKLVKVFFTLIKPYKEYPEQYFKAEDLFIKPLTC